MITQRDDDYLICGEYQKHIGEVSTEYPEFITFQHSNGNFYFAWVDGEQIILRSEAYPDEERMIRGIKAILKNRDLPERYKEEVSHGVHFLLLYGGGDHQKHTGNFENHNEIGRSCPRKTRQELHDMLLFRGKEFADAVLPMASANAGAGLAAAATVAATAASSISNTSSAKSNASVATEQKGFNWMWLLPLLLIPLFFIWKGCNKKEEGTAAVSESTAPAAETAPVATTAPDTLKSAEAKAETPAPPSCDLNWILFDFDKYDITSSAKGELEVMAKILKENPEYLGELSAHTDAKGTNEYNDALSLNRAKAAKNTLIALGIDGSRIKTSASSESDPIATNTDDDSGRRFNRRVELYVKDKAGKEICKSIPPAVPANLQAK